MIRPETFRLFYSPSLPEHGTAYDKDKEGDSLDNVRPGRGASCADERMHLTIITWSSISRRFCFVFQSPSPTHHGKLSQATHGIRRRRHAELARGNSVEIERIFRPQNQGDQIRVNPSYHDAGERQIVP